MPAVKLLSTDQMDRVQIVCKSVKISKLHFFVSTGSSRSITYFLLLSTNS